MNRILAQQFVAKDIISELIADTEIELAKELETEQRNFLKNRLSIYSHYKKGIYMFNKSVIRHVIDSYSKNNNMRERVNMERMQIVNSLGRILEKNGLQNGLVTAEQWVAKQRERDGFFDENDKETLLFVKSVVDIETVDDPMGFANAFVNGKNKIVEVYNYLEKFYSDEELKKYYQKNFQAFSFEIEDVKSVVDYLETLGLTQEQIKGMLLEAINVGVEECKLRNELVLKLFGGDKEFLVFLATERSLYYPHYYVDVPEAINYIVDELGAEKARALLEDNELFLILYRREEFRLQYKSMFNEAMDIVEQYKNK